MGINVDDPVSVPAAVAAWVDFVIRDTSGDPLAGVSLAAINMWALKPNASSLITKSLTPDVDLKEVGGGVYTVQFSDTDLDDVGMFCFIVEATGAAQGFYKFAVIIDDGVEGGIAVNSESWLPWRAMSGLAATGSAGLTPDGVFYTKSDAATFTAKAITPATDLRDLGRGLCSIRFTQSELDTEGPFTYRVTEVSVDDFLMLSDVVKGTGDLFAFYVEEENQAQAGVDVQVRSKDTYTLMGSATTNANGYAYVYLTRGEYYATLVDGDKVFDANNTLFEVYEDADLNALTLDSAGLTPTTPAAGTKVTGSGTIQNASEEPVEGVKVTVNMRLPTVDSGVLFLGMQELITDQFGQVSKQFRVGLLIQVTVQGTRIIREFEVPNSAFNLFSAAMAVGDPLTIQTPTYPIAPQHS